MHTLSRMLISSMIISLGLALWPFATFQINKFSTEMLVRSQLPKFLDRSQLSDDDARALDRTLNEIVNNDKRWLSSYWALHGIAVVGFTLTAIAFAWAAYTARRLEKLLMASAPRN